MLLRGSIFAFASQSAEHFLGIGAAGCKPHPIEPIPSPCPAASAHGYSRSFRAEPELAPAAASPAEQSTTCPKATEVNRSCPLPLPSTAHCPGPVHRVSIASCLAPWTRPLPTSHRAEVSCLALWYKALPPVLLLSWFPFPSSPPFSLSRSPPLPPLYLPLARPYHTARTLLPSLGPPVVLYTPGNTLYW